VLFLSLFRQRGSVFVLWALWEVHRFPDSQDDGIHSASFNDAAFNASLCLQDLKDELENCKNLAELGECMVELTLPRVLMSLRGVLMLSEIRESWRYRSVAENYVWTSLGVRYRRSVLGYLWTVLSPLAKYAIMGVVFEIIGRFQMTNYYGFFFVGSVFFGYFSTVVVQSTTTFINNEHYIKKIYVPKLIFVLNIVLYETVNFLLVLVGILALLILVGQATFGVAWIVLPFVVLLTILALVGISCILAVATIYFRDLQHISDILFQILFFATPIFYPVETLSKNPLLAAISSANPVFYFLTAFREPIVSNHFPTPQVGFICIISSVAFFFVGLLVLDRYNNRIIFKL